MVAEYVVVVVDGGTVVVDAVAVEIGGSTAGQTIDWLVPNIVGCNDEVGIVGDVGIGGI